MKKKSLTKILFLLVPLFLGGVYFVYANSVEKSFTDIEPEFETIESIYMEEEMLTSTSTRASRWAFWWRDFTNAEKRIYENWKRPPGPFRVGIQSGHWKNSEVPEELEGLKRSGSGAVGGGKNEAATVLIISQKVKALLEAKGVVVDLLPTTIPVDYVADAFVSIHADGNNNTSVSGFKLASPQTDFSKKSALLAEEIDETYEKETKLGKDTSITRRMSAYYAFNWRRYEHAVHPMTPSVIVETGFMTSSKDRAIIVSNPDKVAKGIADGIWNFLSKNIENIQ